MSHTDWGELKITVRPAETGWVLERPFTPAVPFESGAQAELTARHDAEGLARAGLRTVVEIVLRDGRVAARLGFGPSTTPASPREQDLESA
jgi:hypothetical protein